MVLLSWQLSEGETYFPLFQFKAPIFPFVKKTKLDTVKPRHLCTFASVKVFLISVTHSKKKLKK